VLYLANPCGNAAITAAMCAGRLGYIDTPSRATPAPRGSAVVCRQRLLRQGLARLRGWFAWLEKNAAGVDQSLFATAPDVVTNHFAAEDRSRPWLQRIRDLGYPVAFVAQNYMEMSTWDLWDEIDCLFIGGDTPGNSAITPPTWPPSPARSASGSTWAA
jgi:hypothetical protein